MNKAFKSERWDVNELINNGHDLNALWLLWRGRANDIEDRITGNMSPHLEAKIDVYRQCADELAQALEAIKTKSNG